MSRLDARGYRLLDEMGICVWQRRERVEHKEASPERSERLLIVTDEPLRGPTGELLDAMLAAIGLSRYRDVSIMEIDSTQAKFATLADNPAVMLALGHTCAQALLQSEQALDALRGHRHDWGENNIPLYITLAPSYLLHEPEQKALAWQDLLALQQALRAMA